LPLHGKHKKGAEEVRWWEREGVSRNITKRYS